MAEQDGQLAADHKAIQQCFSASPIIQVQGFQGSPPHAYEVTYLLRGLQKEADGNETIANTHTVWIDLPYGYPIFPPICKAVSATFHPDFGPHAIYTDDYWEKTPSLPGLILHIGQLITFQLYSQEEAFNPEALEWAKANVDKLPLDKSDLTSVDSTKTPQEKTKKDSTPKSSVSASEKPVDRAIDVMGELLNWRSEKKKDGETPTTDTGPDELITAAADAMDEPANDRPRFNLPKLPSLKRSSVVRIAIVTIVLVVLAGGIGSFYVRSMSYYEGAMQQLITVRPLLEQGKFKEADQQIDIVLAQLDKVRLVFKEDKMSLLKQINDIRSEEKFIQGLRGNVLFNEHYYSPQELESYHAIKDRLAKAEAFGNAGRWTEAVQEYVDASHKTLLLDERAPISKDVVRKELNNARLQEQLAIGKRLKAGKEWSTAETQFKTIIQLVTEIREDLDPKNADELETSLRSTLSDIQINLLKASFLTEVKLADKFFSKKQWPKAITHYEKAIRIADQSEAQLTKQAQKLVKNLDIAQLNVMYEKGNAELQAQHWHEAVQQLEMTEKLRSKIVATGNDLPISQEMISRKILVAQISLETATAAQHLKKKEYAKANDSLAAIVSLIDQSGLAGDREFATAKNAAANRITENNFSIEIEEHKKYLEKNYQEIFKQYFPSSALSDLSKPEITYVEQDDSFLYFSMQCKAIKKRLLSTLQLDYKLNRQTGKWSAR